MTYSELWKQAIKDNVVVDVTPVWVAWEKEGQSLIGKLMGASDVDSTLGGGTYKQYMLDTDSGLVKFALGAATDKEMSTIFIVGHIYHITYRGQVKIKGGRKVNTFSVATLAGGDDLAVEPDDVPY